MLPFSHGLQNLLTLSDEHWYHIWILLVIFGVIVTSRNACRVINDTTTFDRLEEWCSLIVPWPQIRLVPEIAPRKVDIPVLPWGRILWLEYGGDEDVAASHVLIVQVILTFIEEGRILDISQKLE